MTSPPLPDLDEFAADARALAGLGRRAALRRQWGVGSDSVAVFENWTAGGGARRDRPDPRLRAGEVRRRLGRAHLARGVRRPRPARRPTRWPSGRSRTSSTCPRRTEMFPVTQQLVAPTIAQWGTDEQRERYVRAMLRTDLIACQLFSETEAGSDLAAVRTRAVAQRRTLGARRPQGVDLRRAGRRRRRRGLPHRPDRGQARRAHRLPRPDGRTGRHGPADPPDDRRQLVQRGLPRRRRALRRPPARPGRPGLEGRADRARLRAARLRQPRAGQRRPAPSTSPGTSTDRSPSSSATGSPTWSPAATSSG